MSTYDETLRSTVVDSLQCSLLEQKNTKSALDASLFTLYYAQGAVIAADDQLISSKKTCQFHKSIKTEAENISNLSVNLLSAAIQQKIYTTQSVGNSSVCASNIQIAMNAVIRLASDLGSILSIVNAADMGTEISQQASDAAEKINETASVAEMASQMGMEASAAIAEVSSSVLADEAGTVNQSITSLLQATSANLDEKTAKVVTNSDALTAATVAGKKAEGAAVLNNISYSALKSAHKLNNRELNLNLNVVVQNETYTVSFDYYKSPFKSKATAHGEQTSQPGKYPVGKYYIILVKESNQLVFSIADAKNSLLNKARNIELPNNNEHEKKASVTISISDMRDSDGDAMEAGKSYVVFVFAVLTDEYKSTLNNTDDYLTAPSAAFQLTYQLSSPETGDIKVNGKILEFKLDVQDKAEYRCMFLPDTAKQIKGLLKENSLKTMNDYAEKFKKTEAHAEKRHTIKTITNDTTPGFYFSLIIAQTVPEANYTIAKPVTSVTGDKCNMQAVIHDNTTDNFGNSLIAGQRYIPVILTVSTAIESMGQYASSLSKYAETDFFEYVPRSSKK